MNFSYHENMYKQYNENKIIIIEEMYKRKKIDEQEMPKFDLAICVTCYLKTLKKKKSSFEIEELKK